MDSMQSSRGRYGKRANRKLRAECIDWSSQVKPNSRAASEGNCKLGWLQGWRKVLKDKKF